MHLTVQEAQARLPELIDDLETGEEIVITRDERTVAKIVGAVAATSALRRPGTGQGLVTYMADDFDAPLEDFKEYM